MAAKIIDGNIIAEEIRNIVKEEVAQVKKDKGRAPSLAIVVVKSPVARRGIAELKRRNCEKVGINCKVYEMSSLSSQSEVIALVEKLSKDDSVDGINLHPMPNHIKMSEVIKALDPAKDVEGIHPQNLGSFLIGEKTYTPFTPRGIMRLIDSTGVDIQGMHAVVVGRSSHVGLPTGFLLLERNATVTFAHSRSWYLEQVTKKADILVVAAGHPEMITGDMIKPGAIVIDVGINWVEGHMVGDVEHSSAENVAGWITPVPGGVGPMTIAMLLYNLVRCCE